MEKIKNKVCNIFIDESYRNFNKALNEISGTSDKNINEIYDNVLVISDENVYKTQLDKFIDLLGAKFVSEYIVPAGEGSKCIETFEKILEHGLNAGLTRKSLVIAVGGGVVGDLSGYVAASYMRGIDFIQVPTTLLAQVDSSIGGKTGINLGTYKNVVGAFYQPQFTFINVSALRTLPEDQFRNGMSEVVKYGFIYDYEFIDYLLENSEDILDKRDSALKYIVKKCAEIKAYVVEADEKEGGLRKILNFGHTFGHGVEKLCHIAHGEAVSIGMNMAFKLSLKKNLVDEEYYNKFLQICQKFNLPVEFEGADEKEVLNIMKSDKKNSFSKINMMLPVGHGKVQLFNDVDDETILEVIKGCKHA
ncbi:MAG: 3-dehydroquinate synthase [Intestinibacter sp.]